MTVVDVKGLISENVLLALPVLVWVRTLINMVNKHKFIIRFTIQFGDVMMIKEFERLLYYV